jgi:phosphoglycerol transferase MdoB-like AlkP superfamily enzyme
MVGKEIMFIADLFFMPLLLPWLKKKDRSNISLHWVKGFGFFLFLGLLFNIPSLTFNLLSDNYFKSVYERKGFVRLMGIVTYQFFDAYNYLQTKIKKTHVSQADIEIVKIWFKKRYEETTENDTTRVGQGLNLIVIQVESLQNFVIGLRWQGNEVTPNLNRLAETGISFNQLYDQTWAGNTSDATFLANCSLYPSRRGAVSFLYAHNSFYCLPRILKEHGYTTATMYAYRGAYWNKAIFEKSMGFELQSYKDNYFMEDNLGWGLSDKSFFSQSAKKIRDLSTPFFVFLTTLSTHRPFDAVTIRIDNFLVGNIEDKMIGHYMRSMHYVDSTIGMFLKKLSEYNLLSNSIIVVYGDHRARFVENDLKMIGITDMNELRKIPLIINIPNKKLGYKINTIGGLIDLAPTISNILGINISDTFFIGKDLMGQRDSFVIFRDGFFVGNGTFPNDSFVQKQLLVSDLILEKDLIPILKR